MTLARIVEEGGVGNVGVVSVFYDYMLVYQGSSIKSRLLVFPIFLSALLLAALNYDLQLPRNDVGTVLQAATRMTYPMTRQAVSQHSAWLYRQSAR